MGNPLPPAPPIRADRRVGLVKHWPDGSPIAAGRKECNHDYEYLSSDYRRVEGTYKNNYQQTDTFYCRHCLEYKSVIARNEDERYMPEWYKGRG